MRKFFQAATDTLADLADAFSGADRYVRAPFADTFAHGSRGINGMSRRQVSNGSSRALSDIGCSGGRAFADRCSA